MPFRLPRTSFNNIRLVLRAGYLSRQQDITVQEWKNVINGKNLYEDINRCLPFFKELALIEAGKRRYSYKLTDTFLQLGEAIQTRDELTERKIWKSLIDSNQFFKSIIDKINFTQDINGFMEMRVLKEEIIKLAGKEDNSRSNMQYFDAYAPAIVNLLKHVKIIENISKLKIKLAPDASIQDEIYNLPPELTHSLKKFREDYPYHQKTAFIIMQFGTTPAHQKIVESIKKACDKYGVVALRADDKEYHNNLLSNVLTYIYGCDISIAVFERIEADRFNPNVSFEVGYAKALSKPVCLLKDKTMSTLQTDLLGELYKSFDPQDPIGSIPIELEKWLKDKKVI